MSKLKPHQFYDIRVSGNGKEAIVFTSRYVGYTPFTNDGHCFISRSDGKKKDLLLHTLDREVENYSGKGPINVDCLCKWKRLTRSRDKSGGKDYLSILLYEVLRPLAPPQEPRNIRLRKR